MATETLKDRILEFMRRESYAPMTAEDLLEQLLPDGGKVSDFWQELLELEEQGYIIKTRFETFGLPEKMGLVAGRFQLSAKGFGFVIPDNKGERPDVFIPPKNLHGAMNNDRVMARVESNVPGKRPEGDIIRIITHANKRVVGVFKQSPDFGFVTPDDKRIGGDIYVLRKDFGGASSNQKVVVEITEWPTDRRNAEGRIVEVLGNLGDPGLEILSIIKQYDLPLDFPRNVKQAAYRVPKTIAPKDLKGREDRRDLPIITIDGDDAKDLDDAVYVKSLGRGRFKLGVYIADVSHYVKEGSVLDKEAAERATSVYLVDRVLPMLPTRLSNGICSLNEGEDRLVMACEMEIGRKGTIDDYEIFPAVIRSSHRMSYNIVRGILDGSRPDYEEAYADVVPMIHEMKKLCEVLQQKRLQRGSLEFDLPEQKVILDENGKPIDIVQRVHGISESIIEEFMLAANETVARHLFFKHWPCVYRVHDIPAGDKMENLARLLQSFSIRLKAGEDMKPKQVQEAMEAIKGRPEERLVNTVALRCMRQAVYQTENIGHFGLAAEYYCHFTSPIRRYPDLLVHRLLHTWYDHPEITDEKKELLEGKLDKLAEHASIKEREAADAERDTVDLKMAEYMLDHVGEEFEGTISGVTAFGIFVELPNGVEGLVHISSLTDDYYDFYEEQYCLIGKHSGKSYRLGDKVDVEVLQVNLEERSIDFIMAGENDAMREHIRSQLLRGRAPSNRGGSRKGGRDSKNGKSGGDKGGSRSSGGSSKGGAKDSGEARPNRKTRRSRSKKKRGGAKTSGGQTGGQNTAAKKSEPASKGGASKKSGTSRRSSRKRTGGTAANDAKAGTATKKFVKSRSRRRKKK